jgi:hypothetical protein
MSDYLRRHGAEIAPPYTANNKVPRVAATPLVTLYAAHLLKTTGDHRSHESPGNAVFVLLKRVVERF